MPQQHVAAKRLLWVQSATLLSMAAADIWVSHAECLLSAVLGNGLKVQMVYQCGLSLHVICTVTS